MNTWETIWQAYFRNATSRALLAQLWRMVGCCERVLFIVCTVGFILSLIFFVLDYSYALLVAGVFEGYLVFRILYLQDKYLNNIFGPVSERSQPPDSESNRGTRYVLFRKQIINNEIQYPGIEKCFDIIDAKLALAEARDQKYGKIIPLFIGLLIGTLTSFLGNLSTNYVVVIGLTIIVAAFVATIIMLLFPSSVERIRELKYFMILCGYDEKVRK